MIQEQEDLNPENTLLMKSGSPMKAYTNSNPEHLGYVFVQGEDVLKP